MSYKVIGALVATGLGLAVVVLPKTGTSNAKLQKTSLERTPAAENNISTPKFHPSEKTRYSYSFSREVLIHGMKTESGEEPRIQYHGKFFVDIIRIDSDYIDVLVSDRVAGQPETQPLRMRLSHSGSVLDLRLPSRADRQSIAILKDLAANWDFPMTTDTVGSYDAHFEIEASTSSLTEMKKTKIAYQKTTTQRPEITNSLHHLSWNNLVGMPASIQGTESTRMGLGTSAISTHSSYKLQLVEFGLSQPNVASTFDALKNGASDSLALVAAAEMPTSKQSWDSLVTELPSLDQLNDHEQLKLFHKLVAALKLGDGSIADLVSLLNAQGAIAYGAASPLFKTVVGALASTGSPEAQAALIKIYQDPECPVSGKGVILTAMTTSEATATSETRDFLSDLSRTESNSDLAHGAGYALGSSLQNGDPALVGQAIQSIQDSWAAQSKSGNLGEELSLLDVMGNSGRSEFLSDVKSALQGQDLRAKAVYALRYMNNPDSVRLLGQYLSDQNATVREAAVDAIKAAPWNEGFRQPLTSCANGSMDAHVQSGCQSILASAKGIE